MFAVFEPLMIHHIHPATLMAVGTGIASAAAAGLMGRWFSRIEREARAGGTDLSTPVPSEPRLDPLPVSRALGPLTLGPAAPMLPTAPMVQLPLGTPAAAPVASSGPALT